MQEEFFKPTLKSDMRQALTNAAIGLYVLLFILFLLVLGGRAEAKTVYFGKGPVTVRVTAGAPTLFRFEKEVKNILRGQRFNIKPASEDSPNYAILSVEPRFSSGTSEVLYLLADGQTVSVRQVIVPETSHADTEYTFQQQDDAQDSTDEKSDAESGTPEVALLKNMIRSDQVNGYKITVMNRVIDVGIKAEVLLVRLYQGQQLTGYVFKVKNGSYSKELSFDVRNLAIGKPNLAVLSQIDDATLAPRGKPGVETYLRVVAKSGSSSNGLIVPMSEGPAKESSDRSPQ